VFSEAILDSRHQKIVVMFAKNKKQIKRKEKKKETWLNNSKAEFE
jgi:hypothetical protein